MGLGKLGGLITEKEPIETGNEAERDAADREAETQADSTFAKHLQNTDAKSLKLND